MSVESSEVSEIRLPSVSVERTSIRLSEMPRRAMDDKLWETLPSLNDPYDPRRLSERELAALEEALSDGFGERLCAPCVPFRLPAKVKPGLLRHKYYVGPNSEYDPEPDDDGDIRDWEFWTRRPNSYEPAPWEWFPLGFNTIRLRIYFRSQFERFCQNLLREHEELSELDLVEDEYVFADDGWDRLYEKPWYELHALQYLDWLEQPDIDVLKHPNFALLLQTGFAGRLGRLVEQYYWRFQYEGAVKTGLGARSGAREGGKILAMKRRKEHARWWAAAEQIRARRPNLETHAVAEAVRKQLGLKVTSKHIARYIRPSLHK